MRRTTLHLIAPFLGLAMATATATADDAPLYELTLSGEQLGQLCSRNDPLLAQLNLQDRCLPTKWKFQDFMGSADGIGTPKAKYFSGYGNSFASLPSAISVSFTSPQAALSASQYGLNVFYGSHDVFSISTPGSTEGETDWLGYSYVGSAFNQDCASTLAPTGAKLKSPEHKAAYSKYCLESIDKIPQAYLDAGLESLLVTFLSPEKSGEPPSPFCMGIVTEHSEDDKYATVLTAKHCFYDHRSSTPKSAPLVPQAKKTFANYKGNDIVARFMGPSHRGEDYSVILDQETVEFVPRQATGDWIKVRLKIRKMDFPAFDLSARAPKVDPNSYKNASGHYPLLLVGPNELADLASVPDSLKTSWVGSLRYTKNQECKLSVREAASKCSRHTCQTGTGYSGSPLLRVENNRLMIVGVHVGDWQDAGCPTVDAASGQKYFVSTASDGQ